jgi:hypothetical protein
MCPAELAASSALPERFQHTVDTNVFSRAGGGGGAPSACGPCQILPLPV